MLILVNSHKRWQEMVGGAKVIVNLIIKVVLGFSYINKKIIGGAMAPHSYAYDKPLNLPRKYPARPVWTVTLS